MSKILFVFARQERERERERETPMPSKLFTIHLSIIHNKENFERLHDILIRIMMRKLIYQYDEVKNRTHYCPPLIVSSDERFWFAILLKIRDVYQYKIRDVSQVGWARA